MALDRDLAAAIAVTRFGLGAKPGEIAGRPRRSARPGCRRRSARRRRRPAADAGAPTPRQRADRSSATTSSRKRRRPRRPATRTFDPVKVARKLIRRRRRRRLPGPRPAGRRHRRRLPRALGAVLVQPLHRLGRPSCRPRRWSARSSSEAIRPHVFGRFEDMLVASSSHPAMLLYLDQAQSVGPDSHGGRPTCSRGGKSRRPEREPRPRDHGAAHAWASDAGYTQADVTEFARAMTGWSIGGLQRRRRRRRRQVHVPRRAPTSRARARSWARPMPQDGMDQALAVMTDLAASPHTAHHIAVKLARHFVADDPPPALVARLERTLPSARGGELGEVAETLVDGAGGLVARAAQVQDALRVPGLQLARGRRRADDLPQVAPDPERAGPEAVQRPLAEGLAGGGRGLVRAGRGRSSAWPGPRPSPPRRLHGRDPDAARRTTRSAPG